MFRTILAAFAALFVTFGSSASELAERYIQTGTLDELRQSVAACETVDETLSAALLVTPEMLLEKLDRFNTFLNNEYDLDGKLLMFEQLGVPDECFFLVRYATPQVDEFLQVVVRMSGGDYILCDNIEEIKGGSSVLAWSDILKAGVGEGYTSAGKSWDKKLPILNNTAPQMSKVSSLNEEISMPSFEHYPVDAETTAHHRVKPVLERGTFSWKFRTRIRDAAKAGVPNFAGRYILTQWGCGTECQSGVLIDVETGKVHQLPTSAWGVEFRLDSTLLIINPVGEAVDYIPSWLVTDYFVWTGKEFQRVATEHPASRGAS